MRHTKKKIVPFVFASGLLASSLVQAAQLGKLEVLSGPDEPFLAEIHVDLVLPEERASLQAKLASDEAFKAARLTMDPNLKSLQFAIQDGKQPGTARVKITAAKPLPAGFIDTLVELTWAGGKVAREYTLTIPAGPAKVAEPSVSLPDIRPPVTSQSTAELPLSPPQQTEAPPLDTSLTVKRGDTLSELALKFVGNGVSLNQAMAALYEANKEAFISGSVHLIREGAQIQVPNRSALRSRTANQALLVLAQHDDRNVYSAYARQIGLLTVENQTSTNSTTSTQGNIARQNPAPTAGAVTQSDRLQIAPGAVQGGAGNADVNAEELLAKNKALAEANERIALLEKNVSDLQRLIDMQKDLGEPLGDSAEPSAAVSDTDIGDTALVDVPSDTLAEKVAEQTSEPTPQEAVEVVPESPAKLPEHEEPQFNWIPWVLAGAGGLVLLVVGLLIVRARRNKSSIEENESNSEDDSSFSEVSEFDEAIATASADVAAERLSSLNKAEDSDFDLDAVLSDKPKQAASESLVPPALIEQISESKPEPVLPNLVNEIPELSQASDEARLQAESLDSAVTLDFPDEEIAQSKTNSILDDLDELEKGTLAAQEELNDLRKQPSTEPEIDEPTSAVDETMDLDVDVPSPKVDDATWQEVATKLDLAGAYVEIGDADGAKELLNEILKKGDVEQIRKAKALLANLN